MRKARPLIILFLIVGLPLTILWFLNMGTHHRKTLEIISPKIANPDGSPDSVYQTISNFVLTNQSGDPLSYEEDLAGRIVVASLFFTHCTNSCNKVNRAMARIHDYPNFEPYPEVRFLSVSVDPAADSVEAMAQYGMALEADPGRWSLVSGNKSVLYELIKESLMLDVDSALAPVEIDQRIRLIDPEGRLRGQDYQGTADSEVKKLIEHIKLLQLEYAKDK